VNKKLLASLAPLLATAAFVAVPAAAQAACTPPACPHVYTNGARLPEGEKLPLFGWGTLKLMNSTLGESECHNVGAGTVENPIGGGAAVGKSKAWSAYECISAACTALGGKAFTITPENLPWLEELIEPQIGVFRTKIGKKGKEAESVLVKTNCEGKLSEQFFGEQTPKILNNGSAIGSKPGESEFDQPGSGELESTFFGKGKTTGKVKVEGYEEEELISVKNP
jgi:hypothetical protein